MIIKNYGFAESSKKMLEDAHPDAQLILIESKKYCMIDFDLSCVHRTKAKQLEAFLAGNSTRDGVAKKSKHQLLPSEAFDIYGYSYKKRGKASYTVHQMSYIAAVIQSTANRLYVEGKTSHIIRWGGNWDSDGYIIDDQEFQDLCHFELLKI